MQHKQQLDWLASFKRQPVVTAAVTPKKDSNQLKEEGMWADAPKVVWAVEKVIEHGWSCLEKFKARGLDLEQDLDAEPSDAAKATSWRLQEALMAACSFGYMPPIRCVWSVLWGGCKVLSARGCTHAGHSA